MFRWKQQIDQEMLSFGYNRVFPIILNLALNMKFKTVNFTSISMHII